MRSFCCSLTYLRNDVVVDNILVVYRQTTFSERLPKFGPFPKDFLYSNWMLTWRTLIPEMVFPGQIKYTISIRSPQWGLLSFLYYTTVFISNFADLDLRIEDWHKSFVWTKGLLLIFASLFVRNSKMFVAVTSARIFSYIGHVGWGIGSPYCPLSALLTWFSRNESFLRRGKPHDVWGRSVTSHWSTISHFKWT